MRNVSIVFLSDNGAISKNVSLRGSEDLLKVKLRDSHIYYSICKEAEDYGCKYVRLSGTVRIL